MRITRDEAEAFFAHSSQRRAAMLTGPLPDIGSYFASGGVCGLFHGAPWPGMIVGHIGVKPGAWGGLDYDAHEVLHEAWAAMKPQLITGWIKADNRAMRALCLRIGMMECGRFGMPAPVLIFQWRA